MVPDLSPITAEDVGRAAGSFRAGTSIWVDFSPPKSLQWLSAPLLQVVADFVNAVEDEGQWPAAVSDALMHLIPKPT